MLQETFEVVRDENILKDFLRKLGADELSNLESYLIVTAFRSKKLSATERSNLGARNREMYLTKNLKKHSNKPFDYEGAVNKIHELEVPVRALTFNTDTSEKVQLPQKALVCYIQPNPSKEVDVAIEHMESTLDIVKNYIHASDKNDSANQLAHHNTDFRSERSTCMNKVWVDFDIDIPDSKTWDKMSAENVIKKALKDSFFCKKLLIRSSGGWHALVQKSGIHENPHEFCKKLGQDILSASGIIPKEIEYKNTRYVPLPGTVQYGEHLVTFEEL